ncbi:MAG: hypothetical protein P8074_15715 [Anaerolineales bacterium]
MKAIKWVLASLFALALIFFASRPIFSAGQQPDPFNQADERQILSASVQIHLFSALDPAHSAAGLPADSQVEQWLMSKGVGSLVAGSDGNLLITHDHWGEALLSVERVELLNAAGELLLELQGSQFLNSIRYRDGGTMVLAAPEGLKGVQAVPLADLAAIDRGAQVLLVHQDPAAPGKLEILPAVVDASREYLELPVYRLRSLDERVIVHGDSGGGVWSSDGLAATVWTTELNYDLRFWEWESLIPAKGPTAYSLAAHLPDLVFNQARANQVEVAGGELK